MIASGAAKHSTVHRAAPAPSPIENYLVQNVNSASVEKNLPYMRVVKREDYPGDCLGLYLSPTTKCVTVGSCLTSLCLSFLIYIILIVPIL